MTDETPETDPLTAMIASNLEFAAAHASDEAQDTLIAVAAATEQAARAAGVDLNDRTQARAAMFGALLAKTISPAVFGTARDLDASQLRAAEGLAQYACAARAASAGGDR